MNTRETQRRNKPKYFFSVISGRKQQYFAPKRTVTRAMPARTAAADKIHRAVKIVDDRPCRSGENNGNKARAVRLVLPEPERLGHQGHDDHPPARPQKTAEQPGDQTNENTGHIKPQPSVFRTIPGDLFLISTAREQKFSSPIRTGRGLTTARSHCPLLCSAKLPLYNFWSFMLACERYLKKESAGRAGFRQIARETDNQGRRSMKRADIIKITILLLVIIAGAFLFFYYDLYTFFVSRKKILAFVNSFGPLSVVIFIGLQILQVIVAPISGEVNGFIGGQSLRPRPGHPLFHDRAHARARGSPSSSPAGSVCLSWKR